MTVPEKLTFLQSARRAFLGPSVGLALTALLVLAAEHGWLVPAGRPRLDDVATKLAESLFWLAFTILLNRAGRFIFYERILLRLARVKAPKLLDQAIAAGVWAVGTGLMLTYVWGVSISSVVTTSGIVGLVFGFALRNVLSDFFSGAALNVEVPFALNDFILVRARGLRLVMGLVREVSWRSTTVMTPEKKLVTLPNTLVAESIVENATQPTAVTEFHAEVALDWSVPGHVLEALLEAAALEAFLAGATAERAKVRVARLVGDALVYKLTYLVDPMTTSKGKARHALLGDVHKHLRSAGLRPVHETPPTRSAPQRIVDHDAEGERAPLLEEVAILDVLTRAERAALAREVDVRRVAPGEAVVEQGHGGSSMFIVAAGLLEVKVDDARVATRGPGDFFGEMSLLTGEPRSATVAALVPSVVYEVPKEALQRLLATRPAIADALSVLVAERRQRRGACEGEAHHEAPREGLSRALASAILEFFSA